MECLKSSFHIEIINGVCLISDPIPPKPECTTDSDCSNDRACINERCKDPCQAATTSLCAYNAECRVIMHRPVCVCREGLTGNGLSQCFDSKCFSVRSMLWLKFKIFGGIPCLSSVPVETNNTNSALQLGADLIQNVLLRKPV